MKGDKYLVEHVLGISVIGQEIVSYLSFEDMKMASLAFRGLHGMVRSSQRFFKTTELHLTERGDKIPINCQRLRLSSTSWRMVEFDFARSSEILKCLQYNSEIFGDIRILRLTRNHNNDSVNLQETEALLRIIFDNCDKVVELQIDLGLLRIHDFRQNIQPEFAKEIKTLEIFSHYRNSSSEDSLALQNLEHFCTMAELKLEHIKIYLDNGYQNFHSPIINLISSSRHTLQSLSFTAVERGDLSEMEGIKIPNLKRVQINVQNRMVAFVNFLRNQPPLESLEVKFRNQSPTVFLEYLRRNGESLRTLCLTGYVCQNPADWTVLTSCVKLKEFTIIRQGSLGTIKSTGVSFLKWLPSSVAKLCLQGVLQFWKEPTYLVGTSIPGNQIVALLSRFPEMTKLDLTECKGAVTNLVVQTIIEQMPKLQELNFSHGSCTGFAVTGIPDIGHVVVGVSLTQLTGLTHLSIKNCPGIKTAAILLSVRHSSLRSFEYRQCNEMTPNQVEQLVAQNPSLTTLSHRVDRSAKGLKTKLARTRHWKNLHLDGAVDISFFETISAA